jgi:hypothetical protein
VAERLRCAAALIALAILLAASVHPNLNAAQSETSRQSSHSSGRMRVPRETLARILEQPEFQRGALTAWTDALQARIVKWIESLFARLVTGPVSRLALVKLLAWVAGLSALAALAWWLVRSLRRSTPTSTGRYQPAASARRSARSWARDALLAHRGGNRREAARCAYNAALTRLEEEGALRRDESRTPREYLRLLPPAHRHIGAMSDVTGRFERAWYGAATPGADDSLVLLNRLKELGCLASDQAI